MIQYSVVRVKLILN